MLDRFSLPLSLAIALFVCSPVFAAENKSDGLVSGPTLRGAGESLEMLLRGRVLDVDGDPARDFDLVAKAHKSGLGIDVLPVIVSKSAFEVWVPVGSSHWFFLELSASSKDGKSRIAHGVGNRNLRQAAIEGIELRLAATNRTVELHVTHDGTPVSNAHVTAEMSGNTLLTSTTNSQGKVALRLSDGEKLRQITAWTDDFRIGGFSFSRKPRRDPMGTEFTIELDECRDQVVRFTNADDGSPVANVAFDLVMGTGKPNYNFAAVPATFPHCRMKTDKKGEAVNRWFPDWKTHGAYIEIVDPGWATAVENSDMTVADDGALVMPVKRRVSRKPLKGTVTSDGFDVGGFLVEIKSFQGEEERRSDHVYAFSDKQGNFSANCIPGARYTVCVNDGQLQSQMIDLIPFDPSTGESNRAELKVSKGNTIEIRLSSGRQRKPMPDQSVYVRQNHRYTWTEGGETKNGTGSRDYPVTTNSKGIAYARALPGSKMRVTVYAGEWRSKEHKVTVPEDGVTLIEIHREVDEEQKVLGRLIAPPNVDADLNHAEIVYGSIGGETDERFEINADDRGHFSFNTKAVQLGIFAYTRDGKAAGIVKPGDLSEVIDLQLQPTADLQGQLLGRNDEPLGYHAVRVKPRVEGKQDFDKTFLTSFDTKTFETTTDGSGNYTLKNLPSELDMTLRADPIDGAKYDARLDDFFLVVGEDRPRMVSRLARKAKPDNRPLTEQLASSLRSASLDNYHVLVLSHDPTLREFVNTNVLDRQANRAVSSFLNLRVEDVLEAADAKFVQSKNWHVQTTDVVLLCALDPTGKELGRLEVNVEDANAAGKAAEFIKEHAPAQVDADAKWNAAFAKANKSGRRVWARIGQRYCGPCFRLSLWLDDNRELIERDYVLLKVDDVRDNNGNEVASRIVGDRAHYGVPFHGIFDAGEELLIDSESPSGNIGHPSGFEGRRHLKKMLLETRKNLTKADVEKLVETLDN